MARVSLYQKLSKREDFDKIIKKVKLVDDPKKYVQDTFVVSSQVASRFVEEMEMRSVKLSKEKKEAVEDFDMTKLRAYTVLEELNKSIKDMPNNLVLINFGERLDKLKVAVLIEIFNNLFGEKPVSEVENELKLAIKYLVQKKYYSVIFKCDMPVSINEKTNLYTSLCMKGKEK